MLDRARQKHPGVVLVHMSSMCRSIISPKVLTWTAALGFGDPLQSIFALHIEGPVFAVLAPAEGL
jgi:hypothetical protein